MLQAGAKPARVVALARKAGSQGAQHRVAAARLRMRHQDIEETFQMGAKAHGTTFGVDIIREQAKPACLEMVDGIGEPRKFTGLGRAGDPGPERLRERRDLAGGQ